MNEISFGATLKVENWYSYIKIKMSVEEPPVPPQEFEVFPYEELNEFFEDYDLNIVLTAEQAAAFEGEAFTLEYGDFSGWAYAGVSAAGDLEASWRTVLLPILEAAGYEEKTDSQTGSKYFANDDDHQVSFEYDSGVTTVYFIE